MPERANAAQEAAELRRRAAARLGRVAGTSGAPLSASGALAVLHELASKPATAADALALLHELQVHQVELDLQAEELRESRSDLESALRRQTEVYDALPVGCLSIDRGLAVHDLNLTAAAMLGIARDDAYGLRLDSVLTGDGASALHALVAAFGQQRQTAPPELRLLPAGGGVVRVVRAHLGADPVGARLLLVLVPAGEDRSASAPPG